ncbi:T9SS type A sorting domain-containing protein [uncultured Psychroserpens sp.]|uniref:T9SS type A sorting domain-containing protein n=1 Tax=uncultured Psychroserpens sp. TaxID=255436 RepID=UPI002624F40D|nr:T9SS type A sorting domain-containing protein [uncultured Psychroserpens sp.]
MKKITIALITLFCFSSGFSQTYSTGLVNLSNTAGLEYSVQIDVTSTIVTLTMIGPDNRWLGLGFGVQGMTAGDDVVIYDGSRLTDRYFGFDGQTPGDDATGIIPTEDLEGERDWSITSNTVNSGVRTIIATRATNTGNNNDYVFSASATSIELAWARARFEGYSLEWHGTENRGITMQSLTLSEESQEVNNFEISPNPAKTSFKIELPTYTDDTKIEVYNVLGKKVLSKKLNSLSSVIDVSNWSTGIYVIKVTTKNTSKMKRFVKQ